MLTWASGRRRGQDVGWTCDMGYRRLMIRRRHYLCHRVVWLFEHGEWPDGQVDHIDRNPANNRIDNLRIASKAENAQNLGRAGRSGLLGVSRRWDRKAWTASIKVAYKKIYLGSFPTPEDAHEAYVAAKRRLHPFGML